jgi:hypothetical protein
MQSKFNKSVEKLNDVADTDGHMIVRTDVRCEQKGTT